MKRVLTISVCALLVLLGTTATAVEIDENVAAKVNDDVITVDEFLARVLPKYTDISRRIEEIDPLFSEILMETEYGEKLFQEYERAVLEDMVNRLLLVQYARSIGITTDEQFIKERIYQSIHDTLEELDISYSEANVYYVLRGYIGGLETYADVIIRDMIYTNAQNRLYSKVIGDIDVYDEEIKDFYEENADRFIAEEEKARLKIMVFRSFSEAYEKWRTASRHAEPVTVFAQSETGYAERDFTLDEIREMNPDLTRLIFRETSGELLQSVVPFGEGYAIIYITSYTPARMLSLEEAREEIISEILPLKKQNAWENWKEEVFEEFKQDSSIEILFHGE